MIISPTIVPVLCGNGNNMLTIPISTSAWPRRIMVGSLNFMVRKPLARRPTVMPMQNRLAHMAAVVLSMPLPSAM
ncbi:Uncharacterised protein [Bifidobacterium pseudocatenulatum]|nr:Uncharacterised protein [Bifidobacterium pseudocatenulatum]